MKSIKIIKEVKSFALKYNSNEIIYLVWNSNDYKLQNAVVTSYNIETLELKELFIDFDAIFVNSQNDAISIDYNNCYLAYLNLGSEIRLINLQSKVSNDYIPNDEKNMISESSKRIIFTNDSKYLILNSKYMLEIVALENLKVNKFIGNNTYEIIGFSNNNIYFIVFYSYFNDKGYIIELYSNSFVLLNEYYIDSDSDVICKDVISNDKNEIIVLEYFYPLNFNNISILKVKDNNVITKVKNLELDRNFSYNFLFNSNDYKDVFLIGNNNKNKIMYKITTNNVEVVFVFICELKYSIVKAMITSDNKYLILGDGFDIEIFDIKL